MSNDIIIDMDALEDDLDTAELHQMEHELTTLQWDLDDLKREIEEKQLAIRKLRTALANK